MGKYILYNKTLLMEPILIFLKFTANLCAQALHTRMKLYNIDPHVHIWLLADFKPYAKHNFNIASCYLHSIHLIPFQLMKQSLSIQNRFSYTCKHGTWYHSKKNGREFFEWLLLSPKMYLYESVDNVIF